MRRCGVWGGFGVGVVTTVATLWAVGAIGERPAEAWSRPALDRPAFHRAIDDIFERYVDPVHEADVLARGLKHIVAELDPHSHYLTAGERKAMKGRGHDGSLGLAVAMHAGPRGRDRWLVIVAVAPDSPAEKAGLVAGDHIVGVRHREVAELLSQAEAEALMVGRVGETVALAVQRRTDTAPRELDLELAAGRTEAVSGRLVAAKTGAIAHLAIRGFVAGSGDAAKRKLASLRRAAGAAGLAGIVIDLRGNPGGGVDEALIVADLFVAEGTLTRTRGRNGRILREERAHKIGTDVTTPMVVLQDRHTASAAELLAVALQENGRATLVGERSYGKGTVQDVIGLDDGSVLTLTIARYFSPNDRVIDGVGVAPDRKVVFPGDLADPAGLDAALDALGTRQAG